MEGLRPALLGNEDEHEINCLKKSQAIWESVAASAQGSADSRVFESILREYGSRFYAQEITSAAREVEKCSVFTAPYLAAPQMAYLFEEQTISIAFGSVKLLCFEKFEQAVVDFDHKNGTFSFIDRKELQLGSSKSLLHNLASYMVLSGALYKKDKLTKMGPQELLEALRSDCKAGQNINLN